MDLIKLSIKELQDGYRAKQFTVADVVDAYKKNIAEKNPDIFAFVEVFDTDEYVKKAQMMIDAGDIQPMTGIPISTKDNMLVTGKIASAGATILKEYTAAYDATVIADLKNQGAILLGRTNMDDAAMGSSTETSAYGITKNPINPDYVPGGSSGGAAASVAMAGALVALGSDTGGSIRQPASFCGLVGLKPTYGALSRYGLIAMASSLDIIGPIARTVADAEILYKALAREDDYDSTTIPASVRASFTPRKPKRIGVPRSVLAQDGIAPEVLTNFEESLKKLESLGYEIVDVDLSLAKYALPIYYIIQPAEASTNLARFDGIRYGTRGKGETLAETYMSAKTDGFGKEVKRRILLGAYVLSHGHYDAYYIKATNLRKKISMMFDDVFKDVDLIATPTTPTLPFKFGAKMNNPVEMYMSDYFAVTANIAGIPAISIPSGKNPEGLPFGLQFMAPYCGEQMLFDAGKDFESGV